MDIKTLDLCLAQTETEKEIHRISKAIFRKPNPETRRSYAEVLIVLVDILREISRVRAHHACNKKWETFSTGMLANKLLCPKSDLIKSEFILELAHECQRQELMEHGNMRHQHEDIGPYVPRKKSAA